MTRKKKALWAVHLLALVQMILLSTVVGAVVAIPLALHFGLQQYMWFPIYLAVLALFLSILSFPLSRAAGIAPWAVTIIMMTALKEQIEERISRLIQR